MPPRNLGAACANLALAFVLAFGPALAGCRGEAEPPAPGIALSPCRLAAPGLAQRVPAECGTLEVVEDRAAGRGRVSLRVAVVRAVNPVDGGDAVFLLAGGPGQAATEAYPAMASALEPIARRRDIVLVDQRGTGGSNALDCQLDDAAADTTADLDAVADAAADCRDGLEADPALYTTREAVEDLDAVREALGYEAVDLVGVSYGTRVAQSYARAHPERTRALILDGVVPQELALGVGMAAASQDALDAVFDRCEADPACRAAFGNPRAAFRDLTSDAARPSPAFMPDPTTAEPVSVTLTADVVAVATRFLLYAPETVSLLPLLYDLAGRRGQPAPLAAQYLAVADDLARTISQGMAYSVLCSEDVPFYDPATATEDHGDAYLGTTITDGLAEACAVWDVPPAPASFKARLTSDVPALLLSGEHDPVTPPAYAERVLTGLPRGRHLVAPGQGHGVLARGCAPRLAARFLDDLDAPALDAACLDDLRPAPFFLRFTGPRP